MNSPTNAASHPVPLSALPPDDALREELHNEVHARPSARIRLPALIVFVAVLNEGVSREQALDCLAANLRKSAEAFAALGIRVLVEAINPIDMPGFLINTPEDLDALLRAVDHPNLAAQYDLYHMARQGIDVAAGMRLLAGRIGHVQFADVPGRGAPGTGELAFPALLGALRDSGYSGWLGAEYKPGEAGTQASLGWLQAFRA